MKKFLIVLALLLTFAFSTPAVAWEKPTQPTMWVTWEIPAGTVHGTPHGASDVGWPQTFVGIGKDITPPCGVWYQVDKYQGSGQEIADVILDRRLDYTINGPEDRNIVVDWYFVYGGDCTTPTPTPTPEPSPSVTPTPEPPQCPDNEVAQAPNDNGEYTCVPENPEPPTAPNPTPVPATPTFTG